MATTDTDLPQRHSQPYASVQSQRPLRTAFLITSMPVGGAETLLVNLVRGLDRSRIAPEVWCMKELGVLGERLSSEIPMQSRLIGGKYDATVLFRLIRLIQQQQIDAVVTVGAGDKMFWGRLAAWRAGVPVVLSALHSTGWPDGVGRLNRLLTPITDGFIAVADRHGKHLVKGEKFPAEKVHVIRNGVDTKRFRPRPRQREEIRRELQLALDAPTVGIVAALRPEKNHFLFLRAAAKVMKHISNAQFVIVGDGPMRGELELAVADYGLSKCVRFLGNRDDIPRVLAAMDVFALTSHNEANPVSILEAMSTGLPIVATRVGSIDEVVQEDVTGYLSPPGDAEHIAERLIELLQEPTVARQMGAVARDEVVAHWSLSSMVTGYEELISEIYQGKTFHDRKIEDRKIARNPTSCP